MTGWADSLLIDRETTDEWMASECLTEFVDRMDFLRLHLFRVKLYVNDVSFEWLLLPILLLCVSYYEYVYWPFPPRKKKNNNNDWIYDPPGFLCLLVLWMHRIVFEIRRRDQKHHEDVFQVYEPFDWLFVFLYNDHQFQSITHSFFHLPNFTIELFFKCMNLRFQCAKHSSWFALTKFFVFFQFLT